MKWQVYLSMVLVSCTLFAGNILLPPQMVQHRKIALTAALNKLLTHNSDAAKNIKAMYTELAKTQTGAHINRMETEIYKNFDAMLVEHIPMIEQIKAREQKYAHTHYMFYHAHINELRILHDTIKELYRFFYAPKNLKHFTFLRYWKHHSQCNNPEQFLKQYYDQVDFFTDSIPDISSQLVSLNLSLFGNVTQIHQGENTFAFFLTNSNITPPYIRDQLEQIFRSLDIKTNYIDRIMRLTTHFTSDHDGLRTGQLMQICIPKEDVDSYIYVSHDYGVPYQKTLPYYWNQSYQPSLGRHTSIKPILDQYTNNPTSVDKLTFDRLQARMVVTQKALQPESGIIIHRYCAQSKQEIKMYKDALRITMYNALLDWCNRYAGATSLPQELQGSAIDQLLQQYA